jgi:4-hydroxy-tetrahydrodipicolinate synthase
MTYRPEGIYPALVTPFNSKGELDLKSLKRLVEHYSELRVPGLFILGSSGESNLLSFEEKREVIVSSVKAANNKLKTVIGTGCPSTKETIELSRLAKDVGADATLVTAPFYYRYKETSLVRYFKEVASKSDIPLVAYNVPMFTGNPITPKVVSEISKEPGIVGLKDSGGNIFDLLSVLQTVPKNFAVLIGWDLLMYQGVLMGAKGAFIASAAIAPDVTEALFQAALAKNASQAAPLIRKMTSIFAAIFVGEFPAGLKAALNLLGLPAGHVRAPMTDLSAEEVADVRRHLIAAGLVRRK